MKKVVDNIANDKIAVEKFKNSVGREKDRAFEQIYNRYFQNILFFTMRLMKGNRSVSEDLTQEIFAKAASRIDQFDSSFALSTWLFKIARNHIIDVKRTSRVEVFSLDELSTNNEGEEMSEYKFQIEDKSLYGNTMALIERNVRINAVRDAVDKIKNAKYRSVIIACEFEELSYKEASEKLGMPLGTIKALCFRARKEVREILSAKKEFDVRFYQRISPQTILRAPAVKAELQEELEMA